MLSVRSVSDVMSLLPFAIPSQHFQYHTLKSQVCPAVIYSRNTGFCIHGKSITCVINAIEKH